MGLIKTGLIVGGVLLGLGAVGGIAAGVVSSRQSDTNLVPDSTNSSKKPLKPILPSEMQGDDPSTSQDTLETVATRITKENIVVKQQEKEHQLSDFYAFNIKEDDLKIKKEAGIPEGFSTQITLVKDKNTVASLNKGTLLITVKLTNKEKKEKEISLTLDGFKKIDSTLENLFDRKPNSSPEEVDEKYSLTITNSNDNASKFITIEGLNTEEYSEMGAESSSPKTNGLTYWLEQSVTSTNKTGIAIEGKVKVTKLEKIDNKTYFVLSSSSINSDLKLVKQDGDKKLEALIGQIKTTNLLASDITVYPNSVNEQKTKEWNDMLTGLSHMNEKFNKENANVSLNRTISINVPKSAPDQTPTSQVFVKSFYTDTKDEDNKSLPLTLEVKFGKDDYLTSYKTSEKQQAKALVDAGFIFNLYSKYLDKKPQEVKASDLLETNVKLETYFKDANYNKPANKPDMSSGSNDGFTVTELKADLNTTSKLMIEKANLDKTLLVFADYSYTSAATNNHLNMKILYTPSISLIGFNKQQVTQE